MDQRLTIEVIHRIARTLSEYQIQRIARNHLGLSDNDIESCCGGLITLRELVYAGLKQWLNKRHTSTKHLKEILKHFIRNSPEEARINEKNILLFQRSDESAIDSRVIYNLSDCFTNNSWKVFLEQYLHMTEAEVEANLPREQRNQQQAKAGMLLRWRDKQLDEVTNRALYDKLTDAKNDEGIDTNAALDVLLEQCQGSNRTIAAQELKDKLVDIYFQESRKIIPFHWNENCKPVELADVYIEQKGQEVNERNSAISEQSPFFIKDILTKLTKPFKGEETILLEGAPGSGKTTFCMKLIYDWARGNSCTARINMFDLLILVKACSIKSDQTIASYVADEILEDNKALNLVEKALTDRAARVLIVIDGFEEMQEDNRHCYKLLAKKSYSQATVLITSRIGACPYKTVKAFCSVKVIINNLDDEAIRKAMASGFVRSDITPNVDVFDTEHHYVRCLALTPLHLALLCFIVNELTEEHGAPTLNTLLRSFVDKAEERAKSDPRVGQNYYLQAMNKLSSLAYQCLIEGVSEFSDKPEYTSQRILFLGLTNTRTRKLIRKHYFIEKIICQYLGACHIYESESFTRLVREVKEITTPSKCLPSTTVSIICSKLSKEGKIDELNHMFTQYIIPALENTDGSSHQNGGHAGLLFLAEVGETLNSRLVRKLLREKKVVLGKYCTTCTKGLELLLQRGATVDEVELNSEVLQASESNEVDILNTIRDKDIKALACLDNDEELHRCYGEYNNGILSDNNIFHRIVVQRKTTSTHQDGSNRSALANVFLDNTYSERVAVLDHCESTITGSLQTLSPDQRSNLAWRELHVDEGVPFNEIKRLIPLRIQVKTWNPDSFNSDLTFFGCVAAGAGKGATAGYVYGLPWVAVGVLGGGVAGVITYIASKARWFSLFR